MKRLSHLFAALLFLTWFISGCDPTPPSKSSGSEPSGACPEVQKTTIAYAFSGPDADRTCVATWTAPDGVSSFKVQWAEVVNGTPGAPILDSTVQGASLTVSHLVSGRPYQFRVQSDCQGGSLSAIVIDDLVRK